MRVWYGRPKARSGNGRRLQDVARECVSDQIPLAVISGPTLAKRAGGGFADGNLAGLNR